ncbi:hypothetical protein [Janthinobacterium sp. RB2R34]|jgi:hypothetical protein|uniref:hypothetical protein n=1 Tax=Janthinobacterium sp. RB2R34 TaxID=3424193 RepID=UPI003F275F64
MKNSTPVQRFPLGSIVSTPGALHLLTSHKVSAFALLALHQSGEWGDVPPDDARANDHALSVGARVLSVHIVGGNRLWIITEADRSSTTLLLPEEY